VQGNQFYVNGQLFIPHGFNVTALLNSSWCDKAPKAAGNYGPAELAAAMSTWNANTLRFQVSQPVLAGPDGAAYAQQIQAAVEMARSAGFIADVSMQDQSQACGPAEPLPSPETESAWTTLITDTSLASDPGVMFELFNEPQNSATTMPTTSPYQQTWADWLSGGRLIEPTASQSWQAYTPVGFQDLVNYMRETLDVTNVLIADGAAHAEQLEAMPILSDPGSSYQIAYAVHPYDYADTDDNTVSDWNARWGYLAGTYTVIATEWNYTSQDCGQAAQAEAPQFLSYMRDTTGIGVLGQALDIFSGDLMADTALDPTQCGTVHGGGGYDFLNDYMDTFPAAGTPPDTTPPSVPGDVTATLSADGGSVDVSWSASADNVGVTGYDVYRDGTEIATVGGTATSYADSGVADPMGDSYAVDAFDAAGNVSAQSEPAAVADVTPPTVPTGLTLQSATVTSISFRWSPSTDNVGVAGYYIYRDGSMVGTSATSSYTDTSLNNGTAYTYEVSAYDAAGNVSGTSAPASFSTLPGDSAPTTPASVKAAATVPYRVKLSWSASTDAGGSGLAGYRIYRIDAPGTILATVGPSVTSYADTRVKAKTAYTYTVVAFDAADDQSGAGKSNSVTTPVGKTTKAPTAPSKLRVSATTATSVTFTWAASTDADGIAGYHVYRDGAYIGDTAGPGTTRFADTGLTGSTTYTYTVVAFDDSANVSAGSPALKVTTKAP